MFGSTVLEVAIGLTFVFLLFSLLVSGISEFISSLRQYRAKNLETAIRQMMGAQTDAFYQEPTIKRLGLGNEKPAYIPPKVFTQAVLKVIDPGQGTKIAKASADLQKLTTSIANQPNVAAAKSELTSLAKSGHAHPAVKSELTAISKDANVTSCDQVLGRIHGVVRSLEMTHLADRIEKIPDDSLKGSLTTLANDAALKSSNFRDEIDDWFNDTMDRARGWYKKKITRWNVGIGLLIAVVLNVDAISISNHLANDPTLRQAVVAQAAAHVQEIESSDGVPKGEATAAGDKDKPAASEVPGKSVADLKKEIDQLQLPIAWSEGEVRRLLPFLFDSGVDQTSTASTTADQSRDENGDNSTLWFLWIHKTLGLLVTTLAISLGAPFWFDLMNSLIRMYQRIPTSEEGDS